MATEVGTLSASLTLDLSNFRAGMAEAASLAQQLGAQLKSAFSGDMGLSQMISHVREAMEAIKLLRAEVSNFQAMQRSTSAADLFAQMRTHTAALPADINSIQSALTGAVSAAQQLSAAMQQVAQHTQAASSAAQGLNFNNTGAPVVDFTTQLGQMQQMAALVQQMVAGMQQLGSVDLNTGEVQGGDQMLLTSNTLAAYKEIAAVIQQITSLMVPLDTATQAWLKSVQRVMQSFSGIAASVQQTNAAAKGLRSGINGAVPGSKQFNRQTQQAASNLQTAKGYAISIKGIIGGIVISQAFYRLLNIMQDLVAGAAEFSQNMQDAGVAFGYLMKDSEVSSGAFLNALKDIALVSPLDTTDLTAAARKLMAMGFSAKSAVPALQILTDTAAVFSNGAGDMSNQIDHIVLAFGQMIAAGKVSAQELRQLYNAGLPVYQLLSDGLGISMKMAKNAGKYDIDSAEAVYAILTQLQAQYGGAAKDMARTMSGSLQVIRESIQQLLSYAWNPAFEGLTAGLNKIASTFMALVKITQAYGSGGLFQAIFPESSWTTLRFILSGLGQIGTALKIVAQIMMSVVGEAIGIAMRVGSVILPIIGSVAGAIARIAQAALVAAPWIKTLFAVMLLLTVAGAVGKAVLFLAKAIYALTGIKAVIKGILTFIGTVRGIAMVHPVAVIALAAIAAAFLAIVASSEKAKAAIASFFGGVRDSFSNFGQSLDLGFDPSTLLTPKFEAPDTADFTNGLKDMIGGLDDLGDAEDEAGDKAKKSQKNIQQFDEVYQVDDKEDSGLGDSLSKMSDMLDGLGSLDYGDMFDWAGDWATDWGNLSAGLGDFMSDLTGGLGDIGSTISDFFKALTGGGNWEDALEVVDAISLIFALFGNLKWAGVLQVIEGIAKITDALNSIRVNGANLENILQLIDGLSDIAIGFGLISGNFKMIGVGLLLQGVADIIEALRKMSVEGINIKGILDVLDGVGKIMVGVGLITGNAKMVGFSLIGMGLLNLLGELGAVMEAIRTGDWSGVDKIALVVGAVEVIGGLVIALRGLGAIGSVADAGKAAAKVAADTAAATTQMAVYTGDIGKAATGIKMPSWATIGKSFTIIAGGIALIVASVALIGLIDTNLLRQGARNMALIGEGFMDILLPLGITIAAAVILGNVLTSTPIDFKSILAGLAAITIGLGTMVGMVALLGLIDTALLEQGRDNIKLAAEAFASIEIPLDLLLLKAGIIGAIIVATGGLGALAIAAGVLTINVAMVDIIGMTAAAALWNTDTLEKGAVNIKVAADAMKEIEGPLDRLIIMAGAIGALIVGTFGLAAIAFAAGFLILDDTVLLVMNWCKKYATWDTSVLEAGKVNLELAFGAFSAMEGPLSSLIGMLDSIGSHTNNIFGIGNYDYDNAFRILSQVMDSLISWIGEYSNWDTARLAAGGQTIDLAAKAGDTVVNTLQPLMDMLDNIGQHTNNLFGLFNYDYEGAFKVLSGVMDGLISWMESYSSWDTTKIEAGGQAIDLAGKSGKVIVDVLQPLLDMLNSIGQKTNNIFGIGDYDYDGAFTILSNTMDSMVTWIGTYASWDTNALQSGADVITLVVPTLTTINDSFAPLLDILNSIGQKTNNIFGIGDYDYKGALKIVTESISSIITALSEFGAMDSSGVSSGVKVLDSIKKSISDISTVASDLNGVSTNKLPDVGKDLGEFATEVKKAFTTLKDVPTDNVANILSALKSLDLSAFKDIGVNMAKSLTEGVSTYKPDTSAFSTSLITGVKSGVTTQMSTMPTFLSTSVSTPINTWFNTNFTTTLYEKYGTNIAEGQKTGISKVMDTIPTWLTDNVNKDYHDWFLKYFDSTKFEVYGKNIVTGMIKGINDMAPDIQRKVDDICRSIMWQIQSALQIHSPSKFTEWAGEMLMAGLMGGIVDNAKMAISAAHKAAVQLTEAITPEKASGDILGDSVTSSLDSLSTWSSSFVGIMSNTFSTVAGMFGSFNDTLNTAVSGVQNVPRTLNARIGSIAAADQLSGQTAYGKNTNGTPAETTATASLTADTIALLSNAIADRLYEYLAPLFATMSDDDAERTMLYVGNLIADDGGLKALERRLYSIRQTEKTRR